MENKTVANPIDYSPMSDLADYHRQIEEKYKGLTAAETNSNPDATALMTFNGYYTLDTAPGAFFAVDTNMYINSGAPDPIYVLDLLISLDGVTSARFPFTGTFDGKNLVQGGMAIEAMNINLTFTRTDGSDGTTALCTGTIALPGKTEVFVMGSTYNNPIPASLYIGEYYDSASDNNKVMTIGDNHQLFYDNGETGSGLKQVNTYVYNLNMYYFSFTQGTNAVSLIMGTAAEKGFACNNMIVDKNVTPNTVTTRSLLTIPTATMDTYKLYDVSGSKLAGFSGYYQIKSINPLAFVSIQAQYATLDESLDLDVYLVMISVSMDGITSKGYYFDPLTMTFEDGTLKMPDQSITLKFTREYNPTQGSLVTVTGSVSGKDVTGYTRFNPVPLSAFGGVAMTNSDGASLTVTNGNQITYNGNTVDKVLYVPLMYILAYPISAPTTVMSFGTDGLKGNTCIITAGLPDSPTTSVVYAIPDAQ